MHHQRFQALVTLLCGGFAVLTCGCNLIQESTRETSAVSSAPVEIHFGVARMMERSGSLPTAEAAYREILAANPDHGDAHHRLGVVLLQGEKLDEAIEHLSKAATLSEASADLLGDLGYAYMLKGDLHKSENFLRNASSLSAGISES